MLYPMSDQQKIDFLRKLPHTTQQKQEIDDDDGPLQSPLIGILIDSQRNQWSRLTVSYSKVSEHFRAGLIKVSAKLKPITFTSDEFSY
jgi:hypothetical protein